MRKLFFYDTLAREGFVEAFEHVEKDEYFTLFTFGPVGDDKNHYKMLKSSNAVCDLIPFYDEHAHVERPEVYAPNRDYIIVRHSPARRNNIEAMWELGAMVDSDFHSNLCFFNKDNYHCLTRRSI